MSSSETCRFPLLAGAIFAALLSACVVDSSRPSSGGGSGGGPVPYTNGAGGGTAGGGASTALLVDVDPNQTLMVKPGQGAGVFIEYQTGGHWSLSWTCDTSLTGLACDYVLDVSVASGAIANLAGQTLEATDGVVQTGPQKVEATTTTSTGLDSMTFDTTPGAVITVGATVNGQLYINSGQSFMFFVQNRQVNGGYQNPVSNPLMLEPSSP